MSRDFEYENNNIAYDWVLTRKNGGGIKCKNYVVCETILPKNCYNLCGGYLCFKCISLFGDITDGDGNIIKKGKDKLTTYDNVECPICLETKQNVSLPRCEHHTCIDCFKRCYYGDRSRQDEPLFPYNENEVDNRYFSDWDNPKWITKYPLLKEYNEKYIIWENKKRRKYEEEENIRLCPLCRK